MKEACARAGRKNIGPKQGDGAAERGAPESLRIYHAIQLRYTWKDDGEELEVLLDVPESTGKKDAARQLLAGKKPLPGLFDARHDAWAAHVLCSIPVSVSASIS